MTKFNKSKTPCRGPQNGQLLAILYFMYYLFVKTAANAASILVKGNLQA